MGTLNIRNIDYLLDDNIELSKKVADFLEFKDFDKLIEGVNSDGLFDEDEVIAVVSEEDVKKLIKTFKEMEEFIKKRNIDQKSEFNNIESKINEITEEINAFDPSKLDQESLEALADLIKQKESLNDKKTKIKLDCVKSEKLLKMFNKVNIEMNDRRIDIAKIKYSNEQKIIGLDLSSVESSLLRNKENLDNLSEKIDACDDKIEEYFKEIREINSQGEVLSDLDKQKQDTIFAELRKKVSEKKQYEEEKDSLAETIQELEDKKVDLEDKKVKNAKNLKKQEENERHIENRISKFEKLAEKDNLTKIEMGIFKGIHDEIMYDPDIKDAEKKKLDEKYISNSSVLNAPLDPSKIKVSNGIKKQKEVAKVSRIKSRVAKAKVSTLLFIQDKFDKAVNQWTGFKANSVEKKINKLEEKQRKIEKKRTELENMRASLQNLYTNNPILDQEDVSSARKM